MRYFMLLCVAFHAALCTDMLPFVEEAPWVPNCRNPIHFKVLGKYVTKCTYLCEGLPYRSSWEYDGTPCVKLVDGERKEGFCKAGKCELVGTTS
ncbi:hypothetical protein V5799_015532 [Amblyomma americanum]|uniref:Secreted protein n=1 Tax=Amblyomma americanum TaxID=6943 RepID=A0AAQ4F7T1_AMBAM